MTSSGARNKTKESIARDVSNRGYSLAMSSKVVDLVIDIIKRELTAHKSVELPIGTLVVKKNPISRRVWRLNKVRTIYKDKFAIALHKKDLNG